MAFLLTIQRTIVMRMCVLCCVCARVHSDQHLLLCPTIDSNDGHHTRIEGRKKHSNNSPSLPTILVKGRSTLLAFWAIRIISENRLGAHVGLTTHCEILKQYGIWTQLPFAGSIEDADPLLGRHSADSHVGKRHGYERTKWAALDEDYKASTCEGANILITLLALFIH